MSNVLLKDISPIIRLFLQFGFWTLPIIYFPPSNWGNILQYHPLLPFLEIFRAILLPEYFIQLDYMKIIIYFIISYVFLKITSLKFKKMIHYYSLSNTNAVLLEIQKIVRKKEKLVEIYKLTQFRDVSILFTATDKAEIQMIHITNDMLPFYLPNEIVNILEDSIDQYDKDISSLNQHLKNL